MALPPVSDREREAPAARALEIAGEIEGIRGRLDRTLSELDKRRHEVTDVRLQIRRHPAVAVGVGIGVLALASGLVALAVVARQREHPASKARSLRRALERAYENPQKVARGESGVAVKVLAAIATTVGTSLAKKYVEQLFRAPSPRAMGQPAPAVGAPAPAH